MSNFNEAIEIVLKHEGGYVFHPNDPGGETKYGISKRSYPKVDIKNLTVAQAKEIYRRDWWNPGPYSRINDQRIATKLFDTAVNMGAKRAYRFMQQAVNSIGVYKLVEDGIIGIRSIEAINGSDPEAVLSSFRKLQADYYRGLVAKRPSMSVFIKGWLNRANS